MTQQRITELINEHGYCCLDMYVAREFAEAESRNESEALQVIRRQEQICLMAEHGKGRFIRAKERACRMLAAGCEQAGDEVTLPADIARFDLATVYAWVACRMLGRY